VGMSMSKTGVPVCAVEVGRHGDDRVSIGNRIFFIAIILSIIGILFVIDTSLVFKGEFEQRMMLIKIVKEIGFIVIGWMAAFYLSRLDMRSMKAFGAVLMLMSLAMLFMVKFTPLGVERNNCRRWLEIGPLTIQPLEFFKLALVLQLATFLSVKGSLEKLKLADILKPGIPIAAGLLLLALQPNLSAVFFVGLVCLILAWVGGLPNRPLLYLGGFFAFIFLILMLLHPDRWERIVGILNLEGNISDAGYQLGMALYAISRGGLLGVGIGQSIGKFALPYNDSDFIFTIIVEETGLIGGMVVIFLFACLVYFIWRLARAQEENYPLLVCLGIGVMIAAQVAINIAVNLGFIPTTGMPLPFISAGGSNLVVTLLAVGVLLSMAGRPHQSDAGTPEAIVKA
jgi:cell division protein FtsW